VSETDVDLSNWAGNLTSRFIKVLTQFSRSVAATIIDPYRQIARVKLRGELAGGAVSLSPDTVSDRLSRIDCGLSVMVMPRFGVRHQPGDQSDHDRYHDDHQGHEFPRRVLPPSDAANAFR
jgi:hypothetical protein